MNIENSYGLNKPDRKRSEIEILLQSLNNNKKQVQAHYVQPATLFMPVQRSGDAVTFELSAQAKTELRNAEIDKIIESGEPLTDCSYEEYRKYYLYKNGTFNNEHEMQKAYKQALKGDKASLEEREWRHNPDYKIPARLWGAPEIAEDREAAFEKYKNGETLESWERGLLYTNTVFDAGSKILTEATFIRERNIVQSAISDALNKAGIDLSENDELTFETWGRYISVSGAKDDETNKTIADALMEINYNDPTDRTGHKLEHIYFHNNNDQSENVGMSRYWLQTAVFALDDANGSTSVFDLSLDDNGNVIGLPNEIDSFIKENAKGKFGDLVKVADESNYNNIRKARLLQKAFTETVSIIRNGDYDRLRNLKGYITYKNGVLEVK